jgi:hypothetical protein
MILRTGPAQAEHALSPARPFGDRDCSGERWHCEQHRTVIAGQSGVGQRFGNGSTSGAAMFLTLAAVANFNIGSGTSTTIEGQLAG